jgi:protein-ribulosamine 3-kinase
MKMLYNIMPELVAEPIAWGAYKSEPDTYFFVCRFCELSGEIPDVDDFPALVAKMHQQEISETGEYGSFEIKYSGRNHQFYPRSKSWEECFTKALEFEFNLEEETHGVDPEMRELREEFMGKVVPRLLRPLETEGRVLVPRLIHGDLWDGNASVDMATGCPLIFDAVVLYAHNECQYISLKSGDAKYLLPLTRGLDELGPWWAARHKMTDQYIAEYKRHFPPSDPAEDFEDRGLLYCL